MGFAKCMMKGCLPILLVLGFAFTVFLANLKPDYLKNQFNDFIDKVQFEKTKIEKGTYIRNKEPSAFE